ncbi:MAG TPA: hypothetical protein VFF78_08640 [Anaerolineaceae bacterium]|nr:hypothetical protein [Anaerolineaceae bacterium]
MLRSEMIFLLAEQLAGLRLSHPLRVALDGIDAAGKTSLADELAKVLLQFDRPVIRATMDGFHCPRIVRYRRGAESPEGYFFDSFDYPQLRSALLDPLGPSGDRRYRTAVFDFRQDISLEKPAQIADPQGILLFDGIFLSRPELAGGWDFNIFIEISFETSLARAMRRDLDLFGDPEAVRRRYLLRYFPAQEMYLASCNPRGKANVVVVNNDLAQPELIWKTSISR